ncbi:hypothetical protein Tco_0775304 [Tanacetum coccineum]
MYYKKNMDFVALIWEDLAYQIDNMDSKKQDKMLYPRFMKIIINYFLEKDKSSLMRNRTFMHTARDDSLLGTMRFISRHVDTQELNLQSQGKVKRNQIQPSHLRNLLLRRSLLKLRKLLLPNLNRLRRRLWVSDEQHRKTSGTNEGTGTKPGVLDVPKYNSKSDKESWGDSGEEEDDDENNSEDEYDDDDDNDDDDGNDGNDGDGDDDDDDNQEVDDTNDDDEETDNVNVNLGNEDIDTIDADQSGLGQQNVSQESEFEQVEEDAHLLNLENPSLADNEIASLMETIVHHEELRSQTLSLYTVPVTATPDYAQALSSIPDIVDRYIDSKLGEAIQKAIVEYTLECREDAQDEKTDYIEIADTSMRAILKEEVNTQLPQILPQAVSDFATHVIEKNVTKSLEAVVLARSSSQANSTYKAAASLSEFELTKILIDKMENKKSYDKADYKRELYDTLVKSYQTDKDLFDTYSEVFTLKRSRDDRDKDQDPFAGFDQGMKRRKSSKEAESSRDLSHTVDDSGVQQHQEFDMGNNDEQPADKEVYKDD